MSRPETVTLALLPAFLLRDPVSASRPPARADLPPARTLPATRRRPPPRDALETLSPGLLRDVGVDARVVGDPVAAARRRTEALCR